MTDQIISSPSQTVNYSEIHNLFLALVIRSAAHGDAKRWMRVLIDALLPLDNEDKLRRLQAVAAAMESE